MARPKGTPRLLIHKATGRYYAYFDNQAVYFGKASDPQAMERFDRTLAEYLANGRKLPPKDHGRPFIAELCVAFDKHAETHYPRSGHNWEGHAYQSAFRPLLKLYGRTLAESFGPLQLRAVRQLMIEAKWARTTINRQVRRVIHLFRWACGQGLIDSPIHHSLEAVEPLRKGHPGVEETDKVRPVEWARVKAIKPHVHPSVWSMILVQWSTGMRPGEVVGLRARDVVMKGRVWRCEIADHKTSQHEIERTVWIGPRAQAVIRSRLTTDVSAPLFPSRHGRAYTPAGYRRSITEACDAAKIDRWTPNQLRHTAATIARRQLGLETSQAILGHATIETTQLYAERLNGLAADFARKFG